jgi:hypothetical protein
MHSKKSELTRREVAVVASGLLVAGSISVTPAVAAQPEMEAALASLNDALASLQAAEANKGGHREKAIDLVEQAIAQVQLGIEAAS